MMRAEEERMRGVKVRKRRNCSGKFSKSKSELAHFTKSLEFRLTPPATFLYKVLKTISKKGETANDGADGGLRAAESSDSNSSG